VILEKLRRILLLGLGSEFAIAATSFFKEPELSLVARISGNIDCIVSDEIGEPFNGGIDLSK
jgi:hypothetical protein